MSRVKVLLILVGSLSLVACEQLARVDYDTDYSFQPAYNYEWLPGQKPDKHPVISELTLQRVKSAVDKQLAGKGWKQADSASAEILVNTFITVETKVEGTAYYANYGVSYYHPRHWVGVSSYDIRTYEQGTLVVDLVDAKSKKLIWRGSYQSRIRDGLTSPERAERINRTVKKILDAYPHGVPEPVK